MQVISIVETMQIDAKKEGYSTTIVFFTLRDTIVTLLLRINSYFIMVYSE